MEGASGCRVGLMQGFAWLYIEVLVSETRGTIVSGRWGDEDLINE